MLATKTGSITSISVETIRNEFCKLMKQREKIIVDLEHFMQRKGLDLS